jgi:hypothetical protein
MPPFMSILGVPSLVKYLLRHSCLEKDAGQLRGVVLCYIGGGKLGPWRRLVHNMQTIREGFVMFGLGKLAR